MRHSSDFVVVFSFVFFFETAQWPETLTGTHCKHVSLAHSFNICIGVALAVAHSDFCDACWSDCAPIVLVVAFGCVSTHTHDFLCCGVACCASTQAYVRACVCARVCVHVCACVTVCVRSCAPSVYCASSVTTLCAVACHCVACFFLPKRDSLSSVRALRTLCSAETPCSLKLLASICFGALLVCWSVFLCGLRFLRSLSRLAGNDSS